MEFKATNVTKSHRGFSNRPQKQSNEGSYWGFWQTVCPNTPGRTHQIGQMEALERHDTDPPLKKKNDTGLWWYWHNLKIDDAFKELKKE